MRILLAIDGSEGNQHLVGEVLEQAWPVGACFDVLHVAEPMHLWKRPHPEEEFRDQAHEAVNNAIFALSERGWQCSRHFMEGDAKTVILDVADEICADLIIVGSRRHSSVSRFLLGSVSAAVLRHAKCSVQIVRPKTHEFRAESTYRILIATDGSAKSLAAAEAIASRPWKMETEIRVVSVVELILPPTSTLVKPSDPGFPPDPEAFKQAKAAARHSTSEVAKIISRIHSHPSEAVLVVSEGAKNAILDEARKWEANCIFVGSHGIRGFDRFLLGSVSEAVATHAHCCVEVVR